MSQPQDDQQNQQMQQQTQQQQNQQLMQQQSKHEQDALQQQQVQQVQQQVQQQVGMQQGTALPQIATGPTPIKTQPDHIQPKTMNTICRPLIPNSVRGTPPLNTAQGASTGPKKRTKQVVLRGPLVLPQKMMDASNQTKLSIQQQIAGQNKPACFGDLMDREESGEPLAKKIHSSDGTQDPTPSPVSDDKEISKGAMAISTPSSGVPNPIKWTVTEVSDFIRNLPGCAKYAEDFVKQDICGLALMNLKYNLLIKYMSIKPGHALKIMAAIDSMRQAAEEAAAPSAACRLLLKVIVFT